MDGIIPQRCLTSVFRKVERSIAAVRLRPPVVYPAATMDFGWDPSQKALHDRMRALGTEADQAHPGDRFGLLARGGALGLPLPHEAGGGGFDLVSTAYAYEGLGATLRD